MVKDSNNLCTAWFNWLRPLMPPNPLAVTLFLKQRYHTEDTVNSARFIANALKYSRSGRSKPTKVEFQLSEHYARRNFRHFCNLLNRKVYRSKAKNEGLTVKCINSLERSDGGRLHHHLIIGIPESTTSERFSGYIKEAWDKTHWGYSVGSIGPVTDDGWLKYITKFTSEDSIIDEDFIGLN